MEEISDKASEAYWSGVWEHSALNPAIDVNSRNLRQYPQRALHKMFKSAFHKLDTRGMKLIEIGCGNSAWLPYFKKEYGFDVFGIDYSEKGCIQAKKILERENVSGAIIKADAFSPGQDLIGEFDVVCSFGVVEHFDDTAKTLSAFSKYLKSGGLIITTIPNMCGVNGWLHKVMNRELYDIHVPIDKKQLAKAVGKSGLSSVNCGYYVGVSLNVQLNGTTQPVRHLKKKQFLSKAGAAITLLFWWIEESIGAFPQSKLFSRGVFSIAKKKG